MNKKDKSWYLTKLNLNDSWAYEKTKTVKVAVIDTYLLPKCEQSTCYSIQDAYNTITNDDNVYRDNVFHASAVINLIVFAGKIKLS